MAETMNEETKEEKETPVEWYVVNTYAGRERNVKENLERRIETMGLQDALFRIVIAEESDIEVNKKGKKVEKVRNLFPGYLFVEMKMTDEAWYVVRNTPGVTGFIGSSGGGAKPFPVSEKEIDDLLTRLGLREKEVTIDFGEGDKVSVVSGPYKGQTGTVEEMRMDSGTAVISILFAGRDVPMEVEFANLTRIENTIK